MGQCCSSPAVVEPDIRAATSSDARHLEDGVSEMVHALATVRASQQAGARHHNRHHPQHSSTPPAGAYQHSRAPKQLLRAASPLPQHPQQAQPYGLSPRSYNQLQQLLPTGPLHVAQDQHSSQHQHQHNKDSAILRSSSSFLGGRNTSPQVNRNSISTDQLHSLTLQRLHSASSGGSLTSTPRGAHAAASLAQGQLSKTPADALSPMQVLAVCAAVVQEDAAFQAAGITPLMLASLCLIESGGCPHAKQYREHLGDNAHGICQVLLSTAQWLASSQGFDAHGTSLTIKELDNPKTCIYYAAAYLSVLSHHGGSARSEGFVVRAYHAGPKGVYTATACTYLQKYLKAKHWLTEVAKAMAVTVAAAALAVQVPLPAAAAAGGSGNAGSVCMAVQGKVFLPTSPDSKTDQACKDQNSSSSDSSHEADSTVSKDLTTLSSDSATASTSTSKKQVMVRRATADLLTALCSSWDDLNQATGKAPPAAAGSGLGAGSILAHMLPSRWGLSSSRQQQTAHDTSGEGPLALVSVIAADLQTAWQRLLCISASGARLALGHATAAAALAPLSSGERETGAASAADAAGDSGAPPAAAAPAGAVDSTRRSSNESSRSAARSPSRLASISAAAGQKHLAGSSAPAAAAGAQVVDCMPCVIHVVGSGETLQRIAAVCNLNMTDLLAANPEVTEADAVRHNDCIAVPVPAVFPRLYVVQPGDTLHSIARAHEVPMGRLLAKNPELIDPSRVQPGWVVALPGLKGDSRVALPADWLTQAPLTVEAQQQQAYSAALGGDGQLQACTPDLWQQQQQRGGSKQDAQQGLIATTSFPSYSPRQTRSRQHRARHKQGSGASEGLGITLSDPGNGKRQQQEQQLLSVGSGAFLFTVGSNNSLAATPSTSSDGTSSWTMSGNQQSSRKPRPAKQSSSAKGTSIDSAAVASHSLDVSHGWAVGAEAGMAH